MAQLGESKGGGSISDLPKRKRTLFLLHSSTDLVQMYTMK